MKRRWIAILGIAIVISWRFSGTPKTTAIDARPSQALIERRTPVFLAASRVAPEFAAEAGGRKFRRGIVLAKFKGEWARAIRVAPGQEHAALRGLQADATVEYAELDYVLTRQFAPNDPHRTEQWHHEKIGSTNAWAITVGYAANRTPLVQLAIVDTPFQMNHPDLQANSVVGWSMVRNAPNDFETNGYYHSTIAAGIAGAVINNGAGVSGIINCVLTPVDIGDEPTASDMHDAVIWAADRGIRVVNLSWDGAFSAVINDAGAYLKEKARGMLFMSGVNGDLLLNYSAHPHIYAVSMTDQNDQARSSYGNHIDFAAPGWELFSTTTNSAYEVDSGTSYAAPMLAGITAWIMSAAPVLGPDEIEEILKESCIDLGAPGWDQLYGWGRIDFARVAAKTFQRTAISRIEKSAAGSVAAIYEEGSRYRLFRSESLLPGSWSLVTAPEFEIAGGKLMLRDPAVPAARAFYKVEITRPR